MQLLSRRTALILAAVVTQTAAAQDVVTGSNDLRLDYKSSRLKLENASAESRENAEATAATTSDPTRPFSRPLQVGPQRSEERIDSGDGGLGDRYSLTLGVRYVSEFFGRGNLVEDDGLIIQTFAALKTRLYAKDNIKLELITGTFHLFLGDTDRADPGSTTPNYDIAAFYGGPKLSIGKLELEGRYNLISRPNGSIGTFQELDFRVGWNDSKDPLLGDIALKPFINVVFDIGDTNLDGGTNGAFIGFGLRPTYTFKEESMFAGITLVTPMTLGLSLFDYNEEKGNPGNDDTFGFFDIGIDAKIPINIDPGFGELSFQAGVHALFLGDNLAERNDNDDVAVVASAQFTLSF